MSGFEVVGIVLGSIPLVISALEHYADGVATVRNMREYENVFLDSQCRLRLSIAILRQSCKELLQDLPDTTVRELVDIRQGWESDEVKLILHRRLGDDYATYRVYVRQLNKRIELLQRKLKLQDDLTVPFLVDGDVDEKRRKDFFQKSWSRIRGGFNAEKHKQLVADITDDIDKLCTFTKGALDLETVERDKSATAHSAYWLSLRSHTHRLYNTLRSIWAQTCPSQSHSHRANLRLDVPRRSTNGRETPAFKFSFLLGECSGQPLPLRWRDATILSFEAPISLASQVSKRKARFDVPNLKIDPAYSPGKACNSVIKIDCLCSTLGKHHHSQNHCLGFLPHKGWHYHLHDAISPSQARELVPLQDLLDRRKQATISTRQRRTLAFALASALLQVHDTPWLRSTWNSADIHVDPHTNTLYTIQAFAPPVPSPSVSASQSSSPPTSPTKTTPSPPPPTDLTLLIKNPALFSLTTTLLELTYGAPLSTHRTPADLDDACTPYRIAARLTRQVQDDELPRFAGVVGRCMYPAPEEGCEFGFGDEGVRRRFWREVVVPLREDWEELQVATTAPRGYES